MRTLHLYLTRQVLATLVMTVFTCALVMLLVNGLREILALVVGGQATLAVVMKSILLLVPWVLGYSLPVGMLTATLLVFGRFSADQELTATRASGISLVALSSPVLLLSIAVSCLAAMFNLQLAPQCRVAFKDLLFSAAVERASTFVAERRFMDEFPGYILFVERRHDKELEEVLLFKLKDGAIESRVHAARAEIVAERANSSITLRLHDVDVNDFSGTDIRLSGYVDYPLLIGSKHDNSRKTLKLSDMTFWQLSEELDQLERLARLPEPLSRGATSEQLRERRRQLQEMKTELTLPVRFQMHQQVAFAFASIGFTLVGIPLGIRSHRRETSAGIALALVLMLIYYAFVIVGQALQNRPEWAPHLILWMPNFLFQAVGGILLWRANRGI